jgi:hypothetical protein
MGSDGKAVKFIARQSWLSRPAPQKYSVRHVAHFFGTYRKHAIVEYRTRHDIAKFLTERVNFYGVPQNKKGDVKCAPP